MATRLPSVDQLERPIPRPATGVVTYNPSGENSTAPGQALARAGDQLAQTGDRIMAAVEHERERIETVRSEDLWNQYKQKALDLERGDQGYITKVGGDAVNTGMVQDYDKRLKLQREQLEQTIESPTLKQKFTARANLTDLQYREGLLKHFNEQKSAYNDKVFEARAQFAGEAISREPLNNDLVQTTRAELFKLHLDLARDKGLDPARPQDKALIDASQRKISDQLFTRRINALLYSQPLAAEELFRITQDEIHDKDLRNTLGARVKDTAMHVRATDDASAIVGELIRGTPRQGGPSSVDPEVDRAVFVATASWQPADAPDRVAKTMDRATARMAPPTGTSGLPKARDIRAQLEPALKRADERVNQLYGDAPGDPIRLAYKEKLVSEIKAKITQDAAKLDALQKEAQGKVITAVFDIDNGFKSPMTAPSQIYKKPELLQAFQLMDSTAQVEVYRAIRANEERARIGEKGGDNDALFNDYVDRLRLAVGDPRRVDFSAQALGDVRQGGLSVTQMHKLDSLIKMRDGPDGDSKAQLMAGAMKQVNAVFNGNMTMKAMNPMDNSIGIANTRWFQDTQSAVSEAIIARQDWRKILSGPDSKGNYAPESRLRPEVINQYMGNKTQGEALRESAKATAPVQPSTIKTHAELTEWLASLPPNVTAFIGADKKIRAIPGREAEAAPKEIPQAEPKPVRPPAKGSIKELAARPREGGGPSLSAADLANSVKTAAESANQPPAIPADIKALIAKGDSATAAEKRRLERWMKENPGAQ